MRFIIYGAGGIGSVIGAELFRAGKEVALIARGAHLAALQEGCLVYETPHGGYSLDLAAFGHPSEVSFRDDDVVILTMKSQHTLGALEDLRAVAGDAIPVICCQNGVANERMALRRFRNVYAMVVYLPAQFLEPGVVQTHSAKKIGILDTGRFPHGVDPLIERVTTALEQANFSAKADPNAMRWKYGKLIRNTRNALAALCTPSDRTREIGCLAMAEAVACYGAAGIDHASQEEMRQRRAHLMVHGKIKGLERAGGSSWQSMMRGNRDIETDYLNGEIVQLGRLHGVPTPVNCALQQMANELARSGGAAQSIPLQGLETQTDIETRASAAEAL
ncbi:MAG: 2-dehydropantoate 2-reductase N-terminal domain-containing protein [Alphaproteobacteria bacterium]|nr:2-dehydropantoate 2-reductase N-terminal domain-containing protein [Alphaproteobacteria bacterium]